MERRLQLIENAYKKYVPPYTLDEELTFYCPQENLVALEQPRIAAFQRNILETYTPPVVKGRTLLLILPCTKTKPYAISHEHLAVNSMLWKEGWRPLASGDYPLVLGESLPRDYPVDILNNSLLEKDGWYIHRMVVSEPMGLVPYEFMYYYGGGLSLVSRYDDPGLFEHRGNAAGTWRPDCTAVCLANGKYRWGDNERKAYAIVHNRLSALMAGQLARFKSLYVDIAAYVAPKMTHRSFLTDKRQKLENGMRRSVMVGKSRMPLIGVNDIEKDIGTIIPSIEQLQSVYRTHGKKASVPLELSASLELLRLHISARTQKK